MKPPVSEEARQLARAVLSPDADWTTVSALCDCVREQVDRPDFRYSPEWVHRLELTLRVWRERLLAESRYYEKEGRSGEWIPQHVYLSILQDYQSLRNDCKEIFDREVVRD